MKKIIAIVMAAVMLLAILAPAVSATEASPVKSYDDALAGELLYTVNFNGDDAFTPAVIGTESQMEYDVNETGNAVRIHGKDGAKDATQSFWGGTIEGLEANEDTRYSFVYQAKANGTVGKNNSVGVGGWAVGDINSNKVYNNYSNHNTVDAAGSRANQRHAASKGGAKLGDYAYADTLPIVVDSDGFMTVMVVYNSNMEEVSTLVAPEFSIYVLVADDMKAEASWALVQTDDMDEALLDPAVNENMSFYVYAWYAVVDTTIRNVEIYKDFIWATPAADDTNPDDTNPDDTNPDDTNPDDTNPDDTNPEDTTPADTTPVDTTPADTKPADTAKPADEKKGCGGTVTVAGLALVAALGTCAVYVEKKRK